MEGAGMQGEGQKSADIHHPHNGLPLEQSCTFNTSKISVVRLGVLNGRVVGGCALTIQPEQPVGGIRRRGGKLFVMQSGPRRPSLASFARSNTNAMLTLAVLLTTGRQCFLS